MSTSVEAQGSGGVTSGSISLQELTGRYYYAHGLFCATYPTTVICLTVLVGLLCCYPLLFVSLPGNRPLQVWGTVSNKTQNSESPSLYIQQVILRATVIPWDDSTLCIADSFRTPLYEGFKLLDIVRNFQEPESLTTLGNVCLHVEAVKRIENRHGDMLPQYSCLVLSPANFWHQDVEQFSQDSSLLTTIFNHQNIQKGAISVSEMLFGMHLSETGIKRYPLRNRQRIIQYAVTLFLQRYDEKFITALRHKLHTLYPLHQNHNITEDWPKLSNHTAFIFYPEEFNYSECLPIVITLVLLFFYYYFSIRKIELIKSKVAMAFTVVAIVTGSLCMTLGICFFFGLSFTMQGKEIFPYLIILVGLENVLVLTKSVVSTPPHLDVKIRVAQGLSKEGWSITKNLSSGITILTIGIFTFVPAIQEFCIFATCGLLTDHFLQTMLFCTILGIDTQSPENPLGKSDDNFRNSLYYSDKPAYNSNGNVRGLNRSKSHPRLSSGPTDVVAGQIPPEKKLPKRLRLVNFWARTRFFQRSFKILMVIWISRILYRSGIVEQFFTSLNWKHDERNTNKSVSDIILNYDTNTNYYNLTQFSRNFINQTVDLNRLKHSDYAPWLLLSTQHWPAILKNYNISLSGRSIAVLPNIKISYPISPEQAVLLRNSDETYGQRFQWQAIAAAWDPMDTLDADRPTGAKGNFLHTDRPLYPNSPMEIFITSLLCVISIIVFAYGLVVIYQCVCSRNYAEWRASFMNEKIEESEVPVLLEVVPLILDGHSQEIECLATDGSIAISTCLGGQVKIWDTTTGELIKNIDRKLQYSLVNKSPDLSMDDDDNNLSDYESGSPPSHEEILSSLPSFQYKINTNFSGLNLKPLAPNDANRKYDFGYEYRQLYAEHRKEKKLRRRTVDTVKWVQNQRHTSESEVPHESETNCGAYFVAGSAKNCDNYNLKAAPIWCIDYLNNLVVIGCADGTVEIWEATTGKFKCMYDDSSGIGITSVKIIGSHILAARLYGALDFLQLQSYNNGQPIDLSYSWAYRRFHTRTVSVGSISDYNNTTLQNGSLEDFVCIKVLTTKAHQQLITCLDCEGGRVVTGSQDHTLRVFKLDDGLPLYTLHGHCGPVTCLFIDRMCPAMAGSASQDGMLCVWDLLTGACMYSIQAHDGSISALTYSVSYVISLGADERLCVWERFQGHLLNIIQISHPFPSHVLMLTPHLLVTARAGGLVVWDVRTSECVRTISFGQTPFVYVKQMLMLRGAILCDFGNQLRIVRFPLITYKFD